ncbi:lipoate-protein ligase B [Sulfurifustis variabilis]|uniref:Octanoyltransferase n=1 Tax=Sulfurifustis variabilis TaxID=1675686 RepID=A0A1B4V0M8_9GAMM|nr:lipoyl(octanoyl) transferase LipB [Sulfurifustis variabilis]BAU46755.1 lipoate-protein ligase B [Sulfurifustis variabilis]
MQPLPCVVRRLGLVDYAATVEAMRAYTEGRDGDSADEIWLLEHPPVYTLGLKANARTVRPGNDVPVIPTDRGGDITYHGPGQSVVYVLIELARRGIGIRTLVGTLEQAVIDLLRDRGIAAERRAGAPGVYVEGRKIASLGLRVRRGCTYHGLSFNARMDLAPFRVIEPCGYSGLQVAQLADFIPDAESGAAGEALAQRVLALLGYTETRPEAAAPGAHRPSSLNG